MFGSCDSLMNEKKTATSIFFFYILTGVIFLVSFYMSICRFKNQMKWTKSTLYRCTIGTILLPVTLYGNQFLRENCVGVHFVIIQEDSTALWWLIIFIERLKLWCGTPPKTALKTADSVDSTATVWTNTYW